MRRPRPAPKKIAPATERMTDAEIQALADRARYVGSSQHKDVPGMGLVPAARQGAMQIGHAEAENIDNPDCTLCPRKWGRGQRDTSAQTQATELLRTGIRLGQVSLDATANELPSRVWIRDPEDRSIIYEAKRLSSPSDGYKAYPLTSKQSRNLPLQVR
jgi:hypothetical protein